MCPEAQVQLHAALAARQEPPPPIDPDLAELQCSLCMNTLLEPVTTPCGHTWCRSCVLQTVDHRLSCPLCRTDLPGWSYFSGRPSNSILTQILERYHAEEYRSRRMAHEAVKEQEVIPIFVCTVLCPGEGQGLHIHEPKYRLMIKRVMETTKKFGVIPPSARPYVGTLVDVLHCRPVQGSDLAQTPEGPQPRLVVMVTGIHRFRILECVNHPDGYHMARIERFDDLDIEDEIAGESPEAGTPSVTTQVMRNYSSAHGGQPSHVNDAEIVRLHLETTRTFVQNLRQYLPPSQLAQFDRQYGPIPSEIADLSFWITQIMPFSQQIKYTLLTCQRPFKRLAMIVACVEQAANG
ncbi:PUA-like domain-containing protein [Polychytrium aggregatum]|uniref:PUA-like domain-containing protein n=1 Tax=Polychytrium aggregatum TaxID=110093 RepID=UPI0022FE10BA|nr:PUA-like domain-containing protein [Polychytrium aggregatum]KAI9202195.1 PUA-like domain-containing protein [Polychytrium aggregatum]